MLEYNFSRVETTIAARTFELTIRSWLDPAIWVILLTPGKFVEIHDELIKEKF